MSDHPPGAVLMEGSVQRDQGKLRQPSDGGNFSQSQGLMAGVCPDHPPDAIPEASSHSSCDNQMIIKYEQPRVTQEDTQNHGVVAQKFWQSLNI